MQVPLIHRLSHLQHALFSLQKQNPSLLSASIYSLCKWTALILTIIAAFSAITKTFNILIVCFRKTAPSLSSLPLIDDDDDDFSDAEEHETPSDLGDDEEEEEEQDDDANESRNGEFFRFGGPGEGGGFLRRRSIGDLFSLAEIANSKSVVKIWDTIGLGLGLGFGFDNSDSSDVVSVYEDRRMRPVPSGKPPTPAVSSFESPAVVVSAGESASGNLAVSVWDTRLRRRMPAVIAEWGPTVGKTVGVESGGVQKVYVRDDGRYGLTVGDMRNVRSPLENVNVTEPCVDTWWPNSFLLKI